MVRTVTFLFMLQNLKRPLLNHTKYVIHLASGVFRSYPFISIYAESGILLPCSGGTCLSASLLRQLHYPAYRAVFLPTLRYKYAISIRVSRHVSIPFQNKFKKTPRETSTSCPLPVCLCSTVESLPAYM
jgi:hypothetical protein